MSTSPDGPRSSVSSPTPQATLPQDSIIEAPTAAERLRALAHYLDLPWTWLIHRCGQVGKYGTSDLIQSRSRLVSAAGLDTACSYVGALPTDS